MIKTNELKKNIMDLLEGQLNAYGFIRKKTYNMFIKTVDINTIQTIGFPIAHYGLKNTRFLAVSLGIIYKKERMLEMKLRNIKTSMPDYANMWIGIQIGHLLPKNEYKEWHFSVDENIINEGYDMSNTIIQYGLPFLNELSNKDNLIYGLEIGKYKGEPEFQLPVFYYLRGNTQRAFECIDSYIQKFSTPELEDYEIEILRKLAEENGEVYVEENRTLKYYLEFAENFRKMVEEDAEKTHESNE